MSALALTLIDIEYLRIWTICNDCVVFQSGHTVQPRVHDGIELGSTADTTIVFNSAIPGNVIKLQSVPIQARWTSHRPSQYLERVDRKQ